MPNGGILERDVDVGEREISRTWGLGRDVVIYGFASQREQDQLYWR